MNKHFINLSDFSSTQLAFLLNKAIEDKKLFRSGKLPASLNNKTLAMIFEKPSLRTRVSFETAMTQLGGHAIYLTQADIGLGTREPVCDIARVLGRMCDGIMARTFAHASVEGLAEHSPSPVINALSDHSHPCQAMADLMTAMEQFGNLDGRTLTFIGDGNNVARSLAVACIQLKMNFVLACPEGYELEDDFITNLQKEAGPQAIRITSDVRQAASNADVIYTDTWISMGQEEEKERRLKDFDGFQVNETLMACAADNAIVMHCLPAYRGYEITDETFEKHADTIMEEAENRLHFQRTLLDVLLGDGGVASM